MESLNCCLYIFCVILELFCVSDEEKIMLININGKIVEKLEDFSDQCGMYIVNIGNKLIFIDK